MNNRLTTTIEPWYRHRWPWLLMLGPFVVIVAAAITVYLAVISNDGLVDDDYYKQGLAINQTLARANAAQERGLVGQVKFSADEISVGLSARSGVELPSKLLVTLAHPTKGGLDQQLVLERSGDLYRGAVRAALSSAHWKVLIEDESRCWRLSGTAFLPAETEIRIDSSDLKPVD